MNPDRYTKVINIIGIFHHPSSLSVNEEGGKQSLYYKGGFTCSAPDHVLLYYYKLLVIYAAILCILRFIRTQTLTVSLMLIPDIKFW